MHACERYWLWCCGLLTCYVNVCTYMVHTDVYVEGPAVLNFMLLVIWDVALCNGEFHSQLLLFPTPDIQCITSTAPLSPCFVCSVSVAHTGCDLSELRRSSGGAAMLRISH